jgi:hypothetical protein
MRKKAIMELLKTIFAPLVFSPRLIPVFFDDEDEIVLKTAITSDEIDRCISILAQLNSILIFDIEKDQRTALIKAAGMFSRPDRDELSDEKRRKTSKRKKKKKSKTRPPVKRPEYDTLEKQCIYGTKTIGF